jgi:hypothetical protein
MAYCSLCLRPPATSSPNKDPRQQERKLANGEDVHPGLIDEAEDYSGGDQDEGNHKSDGREP